MASAEETRAEQLRKQVAKSRALKDKGIKFKVEKFPYMTRLDANIGDRNAGFLELHNYDEKNKGRKIKMVYTNPDFQRQGVASTLFNEAKKMGLKPLHSDMLSEYGRDFSKSVGGRSVLMPKKPENERREIIEKQQKNKQVGRQAAIEIARQRASGMAVNPKDIYMPRLFGTLSALGFLPMLSEAGNVLSGRSTAFDNVRMMR